MKKLSGMLTGLALLVSCGTGQATIITDLGVNPTSSTGDFSSGATGVNGTGLGLFTDEFLFQLVGGPQHVTIASATNVFPGGVLTTDFITGFSASVFSYGPDNLFGGGDDVLLLGPANAVMGCGPIVNCQGMAGIATLDPGSYYLAMSGTGGGTSGYGGNIASFAVPGPIVGAGIPGMLTMLAGLGVLLRNRRKQIAG